MSKVSFGGKKCGKCGLPQWNIPPNASTIYCGQTASTAGKCKGKTSGADKPNTNKKHGEDRNFDQSEGAHGLIAKGSQGMMRK